MQTTPFFPRQALAVLLCLGAAAQAQTAPSAGLRFSDYLNAVEQHSPLLRSEEQGVESARAGIGRSHQVRAYLPDHGPEIPATALPSM